MDVQGVVGNAGAEKTQCLVLVIHGDPAATFAHECEVFGFIHHVAVGQPGEVRQLPECLGGGAFQGRERWNIIGESRADRHGGHKTFRHGR
ncbi:hypothetical protein WR25_21785 [Diploscapter pachys]|uniref:Uncharacterized protein n=1 Tax=Diploscapter pachys TaxID=2018661 RepID=A0A2A2KBZ1_9BILA|nr:hypothetical protein WR25_21785 [Diploscapter pachys]